MSDETTDVAEKLTAPDWFKRETMFRAEIDLGDIREGATAELRSARGRETKRIADHAPKPGENKFTWTCRAAMFASHLVTLDGVGDLQEDAMPEHRTSLKKWEEWLDGLDENLLSRLFDAIILFRADVFSNDEDTGETGNESSPPSGA